MNLHRISSIYDTTNVLLNISMPLSMSMFIAVPVLHENGSEHGHGHGHGHRHRHRNVHGHGHGYKHDIPHLPRTLFQMFIYQILNIGKRFSPLFDIESDSNVFSPI
jgi:hypothetical protein